MNDEEWMAKALNRPERDAELMKKGPMVPLHPMTGYTTGTLPENCVTVAIEFLVPPPDMTARVLRLGLTRAICADLAKALERLARAPHVLPPEKPS
jgi:hypothetical protein